MVADAHAVGLRDLRHHTSEVLARVRQGETVDVTEHGRLIARIVPAGDREPTPVMARLVSSGRVTLGERPWRRPRPPVRHPGHAARRRKLVSLYYADTSAAIKLLAEATHSPALAA